MPRRMQAEAENSPPYVVGEHRGADQSPAAPAPRAGRPGSAQSPGTARRSQLCPAGWRGSRSAASAASMAHQVADAIGSCSSSRMTINASVPRGTPRSRCSAPSTAPMNSLSRPGIEPRAGAGRSSPRRRAMWPLGASQVTAATPITPSAATARAARGARVRDPGPPRTPPSGNRDRLRRFGRDSSGLGARRGVARGERPYTTTMGEPDEVPLNDPRALRAGSWRSPSPASRAKRRDGTRPAPRGR